MVAGEPIEPIEPVKPVKDSYNPPPPPWAPVEVEQNVASALKEDNDNVIEEAVLESVGNPAVLDMIPPAQKASNPHAKVPVPVSTNDDDAPIQEAELVDAHPMKPLFPLQKLHRKKDDRIPMNEHSKRAGAPAPKKNEKAAQRKRVNVPGSGRVAYSAPDSDPERPTRGKKLPIRGRISDVDAVVPNDSDGSPGFDMSQPPPPDYFNRKRRVVDSDMERAERFERRAAYHESRMNTVAHVNSNNLQDVLKGNRMGNGISEFQASNSSLGSNAMMTNLALVFLLGLLFVVITLVVRCSPMFNRRRRTMLPMYKKHNVY